jgi:hypothetical protein
LQEGVQLQQQQVWVLLERLVLLYGLMELLKNNLNPNSHWG